MKYNILKNLHTDFSVFEDNKLPARSYFIPFSNTEKLNKTDYKNERSDSDRIMMLSGEWDFAYYDKLSKVPDTFDSNENHFDKAVIPCTWQRSGYDQIAYINTRYPFPKRPPHIPADVAAGIYRKKITVDSCDTKKILTFLGVAGALCVYVNGWYVGYSEGSHNTAEFDITDNLNKGENEILCVVYKWSNGTYLECQDMFRENGIFRDVYIIFHHKNYITDFSLRPNKNTDGTYDLKIKIDGCFNDGSTVTVKGEDKDGIILFESNSTDSVIKNLKVKEWSAETPELYKAVITVSENGKECEAVRAYIGFKDIKINGEVFLFNGKAIKIKGVNHHDTHMTKGYAVSLDDLELDAKLMKEYNCNAVRTSHYPPDPAFLTMCDMYGLYVIDEADIETHGFYAIPYSTYNPNRLSNDLKWSAHYLDRVKRMYERDKNHPSITMWSLGNESGGYKCHDVCYDFLKKENPEIPVHYEGANRSKRWAYDVVSHMYAPPALMKKVLAGKAGSKYKGKPFFQCEYAHAMGNGPGGLEDYMQLFLSSDQFMGGCIWEWADHSVYDEKAKYKWTYGGDHNEPIHDGNFCVDGLFFPDRTPSSGALEMKAVYRPIRAKYKGRNEIELWNTRSFADTSDIKVDWQLSINGKIAKSGEENPCIKPGEKQSITLDCLSSIDNKQDIFVNIIYSDKNTGFEIAKEQATVSTKDLAAGKYRSGADITESNEKITVSFNGGAAIFDKKKGLVSYTVNSQQLVNPNPADGQFGFIPHIFRGAVDNDRNLMIYWKVNGIANMKASLSCCKTMNINDTRVIRTAYNMDSHKAVTIATATVDYCFENDGTVHITSTLNRVAPFPVVLPRFGVHIEMPSDFESIKYYGRGNSENYSDFKEHAIIGIYNTTVSEMAHKYIKPQDSGNRGDVRWAEISNSKNEGFCFSAEERYLNFNANHFTLGQLIKASHIEDIPDKNTTFTAIDGFVRGTGSGSCGPITSPEHTINFHYEKPLKFSFTLKLIEK